jgi:hypothetical protein
MFFLTLFLWIGALVLSEVLKPKPKIENARPAGLGEFSVPTATEGRVVPIIWGTVKIEGPNVIWFGDLRQQAMKKKVKTGLFSSKKQTIGFHYSLGLDFAICRGHVTALTRVWINNKVVFSGSQGEGRFAINEPSLLGGDKNGTGGIVGNLYFYRGTDVQPKNSYMAGLADTGRFRMNTPTVAVAGTGYTANDLLTVIGGTSERAAQIKVLTVDGGGAILTYAVYDPGAYKVVPTNPAAAGGGTGTGATFNITWNDLSMLPAYRGTCHAVWEGGYIGNTNQIVPWAFEVQRIPNGLSLTGGMEIVNGADANPMNVLFDIIRDSEWGLGLTNADVDMTNLSDIATILYNEGNGFSFILDGAIECADMIKEIERQIDGVVYVDRVTGKYKVKLARSDYVLMDLPLLDETNVIKVEGYTRGAWEDTSNILRVDFVDRDQEYKGTFALAQDSANVRLRGNERVAENEKFPGVKNAALANNISWRDLRTLAYPLSRAKLTGNRTLSVLNPGDVVRWTDPTLGITDLAMRIRNVDLGKLNDGQVILDVVQDVFTFDQPAFAAPSDTRWTPIANTNTDVDAADRKIFEAPKAMCDRADEDPGILDRIWVGARYPGDGSGSFQIWTNESAAGYAEAGEANGYLLLGKLNGILAQGSLPGAASIVITPDPDTQVDLLAALTSATPVQVGKELHNIILIGNEFIGFTGVAASGGNIQLTGCYRGLMDSVQTTHASTTSVWFVSVGGNITDLDYTSGNTVDVKLLTENTSGVLAIGSATATSIVMADRARKPYPPASFGLNGSAQWPTTGSIDNQSGLTLDTKGLALSFIRRDFRTYDEVKATVDETSLRGDFPDANLTEYRISLYDDPGVSNVLVTQSDWQSLGTLNISRTKILRGMVKTTAGTVFTDSFTYANGNLEGNGNWNHDNCVGASWIVSANDIVSSIASSSGSMSNQSLGFRGWPHNLTFTLSTTFRFNTGTTDKKKDLLIEFYTPSLVVKGAVEIFETAVGTSDVIVTGINARQTTTHGVAISRNADHTLDLICDPVADTVECKIDGVSQATVTAALLGMNETLSLVMQASYLAGGALTDPGTVVLRGVTVTGYNATNPVPTGMNITIETRHVYGGLTTYGALSNLSWSFATTSTELSGKAQLGVLQYQQASNGYTAAATGTFTLAIGTALSGSVQYSKNGGAWTSIIAIGLLTGTVALTIGDVISFRHNHNSDNTHETFVEFTNPSAVRVAYGVFTY